MRLSLRSSVKANKSHGKKKKKQLQKLCVTIKTVMIFTRERRLFVVFLTTWHTWSSVVSPTDDDRNEKVNRNLLQSKQHRQEITEHKNGTRHTRYTSFFLRVHVNCSHIL